MGKAMKFPPIMKREREQEGGGMMTRVDRFGCGGGRGFNNSDILVPYGGMAIATAEVHLDKKRGVFGVVSEVKKEVALTFWWDVSDGRKKETHGGRGYLKDRRALRVELEVDLCNYFGFTFAMDW